MSADKQTPAPMSEKIAATATRLQSILDAIPPLIAYVDRDRRYRFLNQAYDTVFGPGTPARFIDRRMDEVLSPEMFATIADHLTRALSGESFSSEVSVDAPDGTARTLRSHYIPDRGTDGEVLGFFTMSFDATEEARTQEALPGSEESYRALVARSPQPTVVTVNRCIRYANKAALRLVGATRFDEVDGISILDFVANESAADAVAFGKAARGDPDGVARTELALRTRDGRKRRVEASGMVFTLDGDEAIQILLRDVTHQRRMEADLIRTAKLESLGVLAGGIAHDFNNLLTGILGSIEVLAQDPTDARTAGILERARHGSERARELAGQLLTFSKGGDPITRVVAPAPLVQEAAELATSGSVVQLVHDLPNVLWPVRVDPAQVHQVFNNITLNAIQALYTGGKIQIVGRNRRITDPTVPGLPEGAWVVITIKDDGAGIPKEHLDRIFDPYFSTRPGGTGLGLSTAFSIVRHHGGWIDVNSIQGQGTSVEVGLPALPGAEPSTEEAAQEVIYGRGRILVMDDEASVREVAGEMLEVLGYSPSLVTDGAAALTSWEAARAAGNPFDAVIMDLSVPGGMGGLETIRHLRDLDPTAVAVVSSGYSNDPVMANHSDYGFRGVIRKPYFLSELGQTLAQALGRQEQT